MPVESEPWRVPVLSDTGKRLYPNSIDPPWHHIEVTWSLQEPLRRKTNPNSTNCETKKRIVQIRNPTTIPVTHSNSSITNVPCTSETRKAWLPWHHLEETGRTRNPLFGDKIETKGMVSARQKGTGPEGTIVLATNNNYSINSGHSPIFKRISFGCGLGFPAWLSKMFCGFKSRWTIPLCCNAFIAPAVNKF